MEKAREEPPEGAIETETRKETGKVRKAERGLPARGNPKAEPEHLRDLPGDVLTNVPLLRLPERSLEVLPRVASRMPNHVTTG